MYKKAYTMQKSEVDTMKYDWILFDADETLFHFDAFAGMQLMFSRLGENFTKLDYQVYQQVNRPLWTQYQNGTIGAETLKQVRFTDWAKKLNTTTEFLNSAFLQAMADICSLLPGAEALLNALSPKVNMAIITNGFTELQQVRLDKMQLSHHFSHLFISEEIGVAKPSIGIFEHAHLAMGKPNKEKVLIVGDNLHSDIVGGLNFGIDTCWLNHTAQTSTDNIQAHYEVSSLNQLHDILLLNNERH